MIQTMSTPNEWFQFHNQNFSTTPPPSISTTAATTTTTIPITTSPPLPSSSLSSPSTHLAPEGRVSKPPRRRSRASRKTPTTLLNTDTSNFRAMVQQFTGGPSALPFAPTSAASGFPNLMGLGFGSRPLIPHMNPTTLMVSPPPTFNNMQQQQLYQNPNQDQLQQQQFVFSDNNTFFQRLSNNNPRPQSNTIVTDHDVVLMNNDEHERARIFPNTTSS